MNEELLPCPFCGSPAFADYEEITEEWYIECSKDECCTFGPCHTKDEAVEGWNQRLQSHNKDYAAAQIIYDEYLMSEWASVETFGVWLHKRLNPDKPASA